MRIDILIDELLDIKEEYGNLNVCFEAGALGYEYDKQVAEVDAQEDDGNPFVLLY